MKEIQMNMKYIKDKPDDENTKSTNSIYIYC